MKERPKSALRATLTTDVTRTRALALAALGAAVGAGVAAAAGGLPKGTERPLARPHAVAKVACAKCHDDEAAKTTTKELHAASGACTSCHGKTVHASARSAHRALAARGELTCATCHPAHAGAQGITFASDGTFVRWGAGAEQRGATRVGALGAAAGDRAKPVTVPLVALSACAKCHDPSSAADPIASCVPGDVRSAHPRELRAAASATSAASATVAGDEAARAWADRLSTTASTCFDEHRAFANADTRFVAWDAAREANARSTWVKAERASGTPWLPIGAALAGATLLGVSATFLDRRRRTRSAPVAPAAPVPAARKKLPVIDTSTCLGCYACVDACPFDVLAIERYVAVVARPEECCGVVLCEQVCPNGSLGIAEGEPVPDRPALDDHLESKDVPGLYLAGDLTGLPLIKNAINQGVRVVDRIHSTLRGRASDAVDIVVVGAGPAGLSAALRAKEKGLSCVVLEQATVAASVKSFPRDKIVYDPPLDLPVEGELWLREGTKEELLAQWTRIVRSRALEIRERRRVTSIARDGAGFVVSTEITDTDAAEAAPRAEAIRASRVVLAIGRRGTPRTLDLAIDPGAEDRVSYALADARSFAGKRVVIAGLGDTAMEAAVALARQPETSVTISYRGSDFLRGKSRNIAEVKDLVAKGRLRILFETVPVSVSRSAVVVAGTTPGKGRRTLQADALLVLVGGVPSWDLLTQCGIRRPSGTA
ncbi:MAG: NAD(P)-binding domain-containing protein [Deltaproteobacteria bacterium]|nr:NAD(P)-binding domain-containing protein [Deltaproteobacteria bacterium]